MKISPNPEEFSQEKKTINSCLYGENNIKLLGDKFY